MEGSPGLIHNHIDSIQFDNDGGLLVAASSLTNRYWVGALFYFEEPEKAPDAEYCTVKHQLDKGVTDVKWIPNAKKFVCAMDTGSVELWFLGNNQETKEVTMMCMADPVEHDDIVTSVSVNADSSRVCSSSQDMRIKIWDLEEFTSMHSYKGHSDTVHMAEYHPSDTNLLLSCSQDGSLLLWDTRKSKPASFIDTQLLPSVATCLTWQPGNEFTFVVGTETGDIVSQDTRQTNQPLSSAVHTRTVNKLAFAPHRNDVLATCSDDSTSTVLQLVNQKCTVLKTIKHEDFVKGLAWRPTTNQLFTSGWDKSVKVTDIQSEARDEACGQVLTKLKDIDGMKIQKMETIEG